MLLTITTTHRPATDLGYLLHKDPSRVQEFPLAYGLARVFYTEATDDRCTAVLQVDVDPISLVRGRPGAAPGESGPLRDYVNDRPYTASSLLSTAISKVFGTALGGRSATRQPLADTAIPLEATLPVVRGTPQQVAEFFDPLGYAVEAEQLESGRYCRVSLAGTVRLQSLLQHLFVLIPAMDGEKHYWVGQAEVEKVVAKGTGWLEAHPAKERILQRYLLRRGALVRRASRALVDEAMAEEEPGDPAVAPERDLTLAQARVGSVMAALKSLGARRVLDLGCGEGRLLSALAAAGAGDEVLGIDVSFDAVERARRSLERLPARQRASMRVEQGSLAYRDTRFAGWDVAVLMEVIEHLDPWRLPVAEAVVFADARPGAVIVTTPNVEYNVKYGEGGIRSRHSDHRFEWDRATFHAWAERVATTHEYTVEVSGIGPADSGLGSPTQMAVFKRWS